MAVNDHKSLHIVMFPWLAFGHIIPYLDLAKLIAKKGHRISFISTPRNIDRLPKLPPDLSSSITLVKIPLLKLAELPKNAEASMDIDGEQMNYLKRAFDGLETGLAHFLEDSRPDWIIYDFAAHWMPPLTARFGISGAFFNAVSAWFVAFFDQAQALISGSDYRTKPEDFMVPPKWVKFKTEVAFRRYEAKWIVGTAHNSDSGYSDSYRVGKVIAGCDAILLRHCNEFEPEWLGLIEEHHNRRVIPVGLMPPVLQDHKADEDDESWLSIKSWLDGQNNGSVIYVALGTEVKMSQDHLCELAHGLDLSGVPFFLVVGKASGMDSNLLELPEGFKERVRGRGMVWRSWAPQFKILSHDSVGGYLTQCGWGSTVEGLMFGHPLITLPFLVDQGLNSRVVAARQLGIEVPRNEDDGSYTRDSVSESVKMVMLANEGMKYREKAKEMAAIFGDRELHSRYIDEFINFLEDHRRC